MKHTHFIYDFERLVGGFESTLLPLLLLHETGETVKELSLQNQEFFFIQYSCAQHHLQRIDTSKHEIFNYNYTS